MLFLMLTIAAKAQSPHACFTESNGQTFPISHCGGTFVQFTNCSTGTYDSAVWKLQISNNYNCTGPFGLTFITSKGGAQASSGTGFALTVNGSYKLCLVLYNRTNGTKDSVCQCVANIYPIPLPDFSASDTFKCGNLTTTFTPLISSGTAPYGPITWFFGDNLTKITAGATTVNHSYACKSTNPPCYSVTISVADAHGCAKVVTKPCMIYVPCKPVASVTVGAGNPCAAPATITFNATATPLIGRGIYTWWFPPTSVPPFSPAAGPSSVATSASQTYPTAGCKDVIVAVKDSVSGCSDTTQIHNAVCIQSINVVSIGTNVSQVCCGQSFTVNLNANTVPAASPPCDINGVLIATPVGGGSPIFLGPISSLAPSTFSIQCIASTAVTYNICFQGGIVTNACNNCTKTYNGCFQITVNPAPTAHINLTAPTLASYCSKGHQFCFHASAPINNLPGCTYSWWAGAMIGTPMQTGTTFCNTYPNFGSYKVYLKVCQSTANGGCCSVDSFTISQFPPTGTFTVSNFQGCDTVTAKISVTPKTDSLYIYNFGDGTIISSIHDTISHKYASNLDTCFDLKIIHIAKSVGGFACADTMTQKGAVKIGHKMIPNVTMSPPVQCLIHKQACVNIYPNNPGLILPPGVISCVSHSCHWFFTKPDDKSPVVQSYVCDSPKVCFDDTGHFDAHYVIVNNGCTDTLIIKRAVVINGVLGDFTDTVKCSANGNLTSNCVTFRSQLKVYPPPSNPHDSTHVKFIINNGTCGAPTILNFSIPPTGGTAPVFSHCFCAAGTYTVTMITSNPSTGCPADTTIKTVTIASYHANLSVVPNAPHCAPYNYCFNITGSSPNVPDKVRWIFGDGNSTGTTAPCHNYDTCGLMKVKLIISNSLGTCSDSAQTTLTIHDFKPDITITKANASCNACVTFVNNTIYCGGQAGSTFLAFGDGNNTTIQGAWTTYNYCYNGPVSNAAYFSITDDIGCNKSSYLAVPNIDGILPCMSGVIDTVICKGATINFADCSKGSVSNRCWTFSTGSCGQTPTCVSSTTSYSYVFSANGYYYINEHLTNGFGCSADTCVRIHVQNPVAGFIGRDTIPCPGSFDTLINTTTGAYNVLTVTMSAPSINFNQTFTYTKTGFGGIPNKVLLPLGYPADYKICWNAISTTGCSDSICRDLHVAGPIGRLNCSNVYACIGDTVCCQLVTNASRNPIVRYSDGTFDVLSNYTTSGTNKVFNFCHKYTFPGNQLVQAFIDDGVGCSYPLSDTVHIDGPIVKFSWSPFKTDFCGSATVTMLDSTLASLYAIDTSKYKWIIFDKNGNVFRTYAHKNPKITISTAGKYTMMEIVKSVFGCTDTLTKSFINVYPYPTAQFTTTPDTICINQCVNYNNTSINPDSVGSYHWYFNYPFPNPTSTNTNGQNCYSVTGTYQVILIDSSVHGCIDTSNIQQVIVLPSLIASFTQDKDSICGNTGLVSFTSNSTPNSGITWEWDFGDGSTKQGPGNFPTTNHVFNLPVGVGDTCYNIKLIVRNSSGCIDSISHQVCIAANPQIALAPMNKISCNPLIVNFTDNTNPFTPIVNYHIDYGDGSTPYNSPIAPNNISKNYSNSSNITPKIYVAIYTVTSAFGCTNTISDTFVVNPNPAASFTVNNDSLCGNSGIVAYSNTSVANAGLDFTWNYGDGSPGVGPGNFPNPTHTFTLPNGTGTVCYPSSLLIKNTFGCFDSSKHTICISANPNSFVILGARKSCNPLVTSFKDSSNSIVSITNYTIDFGDVSAPYSSAFAPNIVQHTYTNSSSTQVASYGANYSITTSFGCKSTVVDTFKVYPIPQACVGTTDSICPGSPAFIGCPAQQGMHYHWYHPVGLGIFSPNDSSAQPVVNPTSSTMYSLAVKNQYGCRDTDSVFVFVKGLLVPYAGRDTFVCQGGAIHLFAQGGLSYTWIQKSDYSIISHSNDFVYTPQKSDVFECVIVGDCNTDSATVGVSVFANPYVYTIPTTANIIAGRPLKINAFALDTTQHPAQYALGLYNWYPNYNINCTNCDSVLVSPDVNTTYTTVFTNNYGCKDSAEVTIFVLCDRNNSLYVPNAFEPVAGSNGRNAYFYVQGTGIKEITYMRIYNRWGTEVFSTEHIPINKPEAGWDGTFKGTKVGIDVYMYQMQVECANGGFIPISGNVTVIK